MPSKAPCPICSGNQRDRLNGTGLLCIHPGERFMSAKSIWFHSFSAVRICNNAFLHKSRISHCFSKAAISDLSPYDGLSRHEGGRADVRNAIDVRGTGVSLATIWRDSGLSAAARACGSTEAHAARGKVGPTWLINTLAFDAGHIQRPRQLAGRTASAVGFCSATQGGPEICRAPGAHSLRTNGAVATGRRRARGLSGGRL